MHSTGWIQLEGEGQESLLKQSREVSMPAQSVGGRVGDRYGGRGANSICSEEATECAVFLMLTLPASE